MTKIEEVARAIVYPDEWDDYTPALQEGARIMARRAIEAMREPSEAMVDSGVAFALNVAVSGEGGWTKYITEKHRAMIDAALKETP